MPETRDAFEYLPILRELRDDLDTAFHAQENVADLLIKPVRKHRLAALDSTRRRLLRYPRRVVVTVAIAVVAVPAAAVAATQLITANQVAASLPAGTLSLLGTDPTCTVVTANVEYQCTLANAPNWNATAVRHVSSNPTPGVTNLPPNGAIVQTTGTSTVTTTTATTPTTPQVISWYEAIAATVDATKHVNGACRALSSTGTQWDCYIGEAAVQQNLISQGFLGQYAPYPGVA